MIGSWIGEFIKRYFGELVVVLDTVFDFVFQQPATTFGAYASSAQPGPVEWVMSLLPVLGVVGSGVSLLYVLIDSVPGVRLDQADRLLTASGLYLLTVAGEYVVTGQILVLRVSDRIRTQSAVLIDLYQHGGEQLGIEAFTWGVLGNPQWEFAAQVVVLVGLVAVWTRRTPATTRPEWRRRSSVVTRI